jgi:hypothetical protein
LIAELERRQVRLGWDAVILIGEWDSFYGRTLPIEFRAAACAKIATFPETDLKAIQVPVQVKQWCQTIAQAIDLQIQRPADYESLLLNVFRYSYLSGLDGEMPERHAPPKRGPTQKERTRRGTGRKARGKPTMCARWWRAFTMKGKGPGRSAFWAQIPMTRC